LFSLFSATGDWIEKGLAVMEINGLDWRYTCEELNLEIPGTVIRVAANDFGKGL
jgi:membrane protein implicated in regulation of membrane protease activity